MKYLGLDLGTKTLGLAISDKTGTVASFYDNIRYTDEQWLLNKIVSIIEEEKIECLVLGLPKNMNNSYGFRAEETIAFKDKLEKLITVPIILEDERLTTSIANQVLISYDMSRKKRKNFKDGISAVIILQSYLDRKDKQYE